MKRAEAWVDPIREAAAASTIVDIKESIRLAEAVREAEPEWLKNLRAIATRSGFDFLLCEQVRSARWINARDRERGFIATARLALIAVPTGEPLRRAMIRDVLARIILEREGKPVRRADIRAWARKHTAEPDISVDDALAKARPANNVRRRGVR